jgi:hypothetical protein
MSAKYSTWNDIARQRRCVQSYGAASRRCHVAAHASKRASEPRRRDKGHYVPAEIGKLLVDALESHGCLCVCVRLV